MDYNVVKANEVQRRISEGVMDYRRKRVDSFDPNEATRRVTQGVLDFHKVGSAHTGLDMSKIARHGTDMYDSSTSEFAKIKAHEAGTKRNQASGLAAPPELKLDRKNSLGYEERARIEASQLATEREYMTNLQRYD